MNRLLEVLTREEPNMAVVFTDHLSDHQVDYIAEFADVAELRVDKYPTYEEDYLIFQAGRLAVMPILTTIRTEAEGGSWYEPESKRLKLFSVLMPLSDGVDIELGAEISDDLVEMAVEQEKVVIVSKHHLERTPGIGELTEELQEAREAGADYAKFAVRAQTEAEFQQLVEFTMENRGDVIVVATDRFGPLSRVVMPSLGSLMTYAHAGPNGLVPGQMGYAETRDLLSLFYKTDNQ